MFEAEKDSTLSVPKEAYVFTVHTAAQLINTKNRNALVKELRRWALCDEGLFEATYMQLVEVFSEYVQSFSESATQRVPVQWLFSALRRAVLLHSGFAKHLSITHGKRYAASDAGARMLFAVFSAGLLFEVGALLSGRQVDLCDHIGRYKARWSVFEGPLTQYAEFYKVRYGRSMPEVLLKPTTIALAKQIMPLRAFLWLSEHDEVLHYWFEGLWRLDAFFEGYRVECDVEALLQKEAWALEEVEVDAFVSQETLEAERFWNWVQEAVQSESLPQDLIAEVDGECVVDVAGLVGQYQRVYLQADHAVVLMQKFNYLGIAQLDGQDYKYKQYFSLPPEKASQAANRLFGSKQTAVKTEKKRFALMDERSKSFYFGTALAQTRGRWQTHEPLTTRDTLERLNKKAHTRATRRLRPKHS